MGTADPPGGCRTRRQLEHPRPTAQRRGYIAERSRILDEHCHAIGRDPQEITRSVQTHAFPDDPGRTRRTVFELVDAGVNHVVLNLFKPFGPGLARWAADEIIEPVRAQLD